MKTVLTIACLFVPTIAWAQSQESRDAPPTTTAVERTWTVAVEPTFGFGSSEGFAEDTSTLIDESSFKTGLSLKLPLDSGWSFKLTPEIGYSPNRYDADAPSSAASLSIRLQHSENTSSAESTTGLIKAQDSRTWFVEYKPGVTMTDLFSDTQRRDETFGGGVTFSNIANYLCGPEETPNPDREDNPYAPNGCTMPGGLTYILTPGIEFQDSSDDARDIFRPYLTGKVTWPLWGRQFGFEARGEGRFFDSATVPGGDAREDYRFAATLSVTLWEQSISKTQPWGLKVDLGVRYLRKWSNLDSAEGEEVLLVPSIGYSRRF